VQQTLGTRRRRQGGAQDLLAQRRWEVCAPLGGIPEAQRQGKEIWTRLSAALKAGCCLHLDFLEACVPAILESRESALPTMSGV
jgi:hypothetical protein